MAVKRRLDVEMVRRKMTSSRQNAQALIDAKCVTVGGFTATKAATMVDDAVSIKIINAEADRWASRGAHKLLGALDAFADRGLSVKGLRVLDAGASTGGFTDVLLDRGASEVIAVDVGYGQLIQRLANDDRVRVIDRTNVRTLTGEAIGGMVDAMVGDLSFISLRLVLPAIAAVVSEGGFLLPMIKPQFEVGKDRLPKGAVVSNPQLRAEACREVITAAQSMGLSCRGVVASPLPGPAGNVEYFAWLVNDRGASACDDDALADMVAAAVAAGPDAKTPTSEGQQ